MAESPKQASTAHAARNARRDPIRTAVTDPRGRVNVGESDPVLTKPWDWRHSSSRTEAILAILNIKDLPEPLYQRLKLQARAERRSLSQEVIRLLEQAVGESPPSSILELEGLGARYWQGIDAAAHVASERDAWE